MEEKFLYVLGTIPNSQQSYIPKHTYQKSYKFHKQNIPPAQYRLFYTTCITQYNTQISKKTYRQQTLGNPNHIWQENLQRFCNDPTQQLIQIFNYQQFYSSSNLSIFFRDQLFYILHTHINFLKKITVERQHQSKDLCQVIFFIQLHVVSQSSKIKSKKYNSNKQLYQNNKVKILCQLLLVTRRKNFDPSKYFYKNNN
eukprot:TRINITY_DN5601_c0_g4_i1.p2 TRINITY_DN5601_c0_g4~~TRINITY_DN5601_c0_g4_i1.p2  ORF type:complete len:218 (+),score=0.38 TRINITY_DN5601_c0_g4_i1:61-654(+)